jgi:hypothetical protein
VGIDFPTRVYRNNYEGLMYRRLVNRSVVFRHHFERSIYLAMAEYATDRKSPTNGIRLLFEHYLEYYEEF